MSHTPEEMPERPHERAIAALDRELERLDQARAAHSHDLEKARGQANALSQQMAKTEEALLRVSEEHRKVREGIAVLEAASGGRYTPSEVRKVLGIDAQETYPWHVRHGFMQNYNSADDGQCIARPNGVTCGRAGSHPIHKLDKE